MIEPLRIGATRSSIRWEERPGNWDKLNCRAIFPSGNEWGIPDLPAAKDEPARLVAYNERAAIRAAGPDSGTAVHFFLDDYRFETIWSKPERALSRTASVGLALTPDFSLWSNMPLVMQQWQTYRNRWCGAWMLHHGISVIPTVSWSTPASYPFAFAGITPGSVVAISTVGTRRHRETRKLFTEGLTEMVAQIRPSLILNYGAAATCPVDVAIRNYPTRWDTR